ncbi:PAS domain-containing hybrid sensor histidine kinase/response regulator [Leeuwenhoekiella marinoflava]|uniref:Sensory/regulatory protein RpfC n=2 Tax=Leeuwenhoekiella marinoflava TaxID=988 RepID=A0A4Q0PLW7_9FLAO|nr:PAS domain-containing hybrid sensor histidine kinase/response regulator [Leeuwenhoekiella marinoflava]RXG30717.1 hypothetical protein DSL99_1760 [Leeuwenhoekiella marinoflava]SHF18732.1 PAS/PAC sensor hybrid histidine kinase [Leeuwenhoekiella marinoflava DSM 3653]
MSKSEFFKEDFHRILCEDSDIFSWITNEATLGIYYINLEFQDRYFITQSFWSILGYAEPAKDVELDLWWAVLGPAGKKTIEDLVQALSANESAKSTNYFSFFSNSKKILTAKSTHSVYTDSNGSRHLIVKFIRDVDKEFSSNKYLKKIKKLRKFNEIYEETNDLACVGGWEVDLIENTITWTRVTKEIHGVPPDYEPQIETGVNFYKEGEHRDRLIALFTACVEEGKNFDDEFIVVTYDGTEKWVRSMGKPELKNGTCVRVYGAFQDISKRKHHQEAHKKAELRFSKVFENSAIGIILVNSQNKLEMANPAARKIFGLNSLSDEEVLNYTFKDVIKPEYLELAIQKRCELLSGAIENYNIEVECLHYSGSTIWCNINCSLILVGDLGSDIVITQIEDITDRKNLERKALENAKRFKRVFEYSPNGMALVDLHGRWRSVNHNLAQMIGYTREELLKKSLNEITHPDDRNNDNQLFSKVISRELATYQIEKRYLHKSGSIVHCFLTVSGLLDEHGHVRSLIGQVVDMTDELNAKQALRDSLNDMRVILDSTTQVIIVETDLNHVIRKFNKGAENLLGYTAKEMIGKQKPGIFHKKEEVQNYALELEKQYGEQVDKHDIFTFKINRGELEASDWTYVRKDGSTFPVQLVVTAIKDANGNTKGYLGVSADISTLKAMEHSLLKAKHKAEAANKSKSEFLANMSHEIRTPLNGVIGFSDLLLKTKLDANQQKYMETVYASAVSLLDLINDILDFSKIEAGKLELSEERVNISEICGRSVEMIKQQAHQKELEVLLNIPNGLDANIMADGLRLRQILINLLSNAFKFTHKGEIEVKVEAKGLIDDNQKKRYTFSIRDTGIGIAPQNLKKIFRAFDQADASTTRKYGGTGLGLTISNRLLELMGSKLEVTSELGKGTTFSFTVDFTTIDSQQIENKLERSLKKVLVVEDNLNNRYIIDEMLRERNIETTLVSNGVDAIEILEKKNNYDLAIVDFHMPYLNGLDLVEHLRNELKITKEELPVLLMHSSGDDQELNARCEKLDIVSKMVKPVLRNELYEFFDNLESPPIDNEEISTISEPFNLQDKTPRILIAEDNPVNKFLTRTIIKKIVPDAVLVEVDNGQEAIEAYKQTKIDFVLMDIQMPVLSGFEATKAIREIESNSSRVPIIALTARAIKGERERCIEHGMDDYIAKPIVLEDLKQALIRYLSNTEKDRVTK